MPLELLMIQYLLTRTAGDSLIYAKLHRCKIYRATFVYVNGSSLAVYD